MIAFDNIKELLNTLKREEALISELFAKRKQLNFQYGFALALLDDDANRLQQLLEHGIVRQNGEQLALDNIYLDFFEQVFAINETLNIAYIDENIQTIQDNIIYYFNETRDTRKNDYLSMIKRTFRNIGLTTLNNVIRLRRQIEETFKGESNYKNKQLKLEKFDDKRRVIDALLDKTLAVIDDEETTFFHLALDEELDAIILQVKLIGRECKHNLIEIERQIIDYLNQIKLQGELVEKIRKIKHLKDHLRLQAETDFDHVVANRNAVIFEPLVRDKLHLALDSLYNDDEVIELIRQHADKRQNRPQFKTPIAEPIADDELQTDIEQTPVINKKILKNQFLASSDNLFHFVVHYPFSHVVDFSERVTLFCQLASQYERELHFTEDYQSQQGVEFAMVYAR